MQQCTRPPRCRYVASVLHLEPRLDAEQIRIFITDSKRAPGSVFNQRLERHDLCDCADHSEQIGICHAAKYNQYYTQNGHAELGLNLAVVLNRASIRSNSVSASSAPPGAWQADTQWFRSIEWIPNLAALVQIAPVSLLDWGVVRSNRRRQCHLAGSGRREMNKDTAHFKRALS
jgi:hypothetical protein